MEIKLQTDDRFRVDVSEGSFDNFINIQKAGYAGLAIDLFTGFQYVEIRKKEGILRVFTFPKKSMKKEYDFGFWVDAEVVYSINEQTMNKR